MLVFKDSIKPKITEAIRTTLETELPPLLKSKLIGMGHISEIYDGIGLDWQLAKAP